MINDNKSCRRIASNQMFLNFSPTRYPGGSSHEIGDSWSGLAGKTRRKASVELICRALRRRLLLIDTRLDSRNESLRKPIRAGIPPAGPMAVFAAPF